MALNQQLDQAAAYQALRRAAVYGRAFRDGLDDEAEAEPVSAAEVLPTDLHLTYEGSDGEYTERVVTLLTAWRTNEVVYFRGRCHMRRAMRTFRADNVVELICLATGEVPDDAEAWIVEHAFFEGDRETDYTPHALRGCRDELALLAFVGAADGVFDDNEVEVAIDHVMMSTDRDIDRERAGKYIRRLAPSVADLSDHLHALSRRPDRWPRLKRAMRRLVDADRLAPIEEQMAWSEIEDQFEKELGARDEAREASAGREIGEMLSTSHLMVRMELAQPDVQVMVSAALSGSIGPR
jgi:hypothetical protein